MSPPACYVSHHLPGIMLRPVSCAPTPGCGACACPAPDCAARPRPTPGCGPCPAPGGGLANPTLMHSGTTLALVYRGQGWPGCNRTVTAVLPGRWFTSSGGTTCRADSGQTGTCRAKPYMLRTMTPTTPHSGLQCMVTDLPDRRPALLHQHPWPLQPRPAPVVAPVVLLHLYGAESVWGATLGARVVGCSCGCLPITSVTLCHMLQCHAYMARIHGSPSASCMAVRLKSMPACWMSHLAPGRNEPLFGVFHGQPMPARIDIVCWRSERED